MLASERSTAVCIVRVEPQSLGVLITVIINRDISNGTTDPPRHFLDVAGATSAVTNFLESVVRE